MLQHYLDWVHSLYRINDHDPVFGWLSNVQELVLDVDRWSPVTVLSLVTQMNRSIQFLRDVLQMSEAAVDLPLGVTSTRVVGAISCLMEDEKRLLPRTLFAIHCKQKVTALSNEHNYDLYR